MPDPRPDRAAVVLCGGESSRMGRPKALLPFGPETLLQRVVRVCGEACGEVVVVAAAGQELPSLPAGVRVARDERAQRGPLEGIARGLAAVEAPAAFVTPCDVPFLRASLVAGLFDALGAASIAQAVVDGFPQPLLAVYRRDLAPRAEELLAADRRRVIFLAEGVEVAVLDDGAVRALDPDLASFRNCNTPEDYAAALRDAGCGDGNDRPLRVEFFGIARSRTGRDAVVLLVPAAATLGDALERLAAAEPMLRGAVIGAGDRRLAAGSAASLDGRRFVSDPAEPLPAGVPLLLVPATAGG